MLHHASYLAIQKWFWDSSADVATESFRHSISGQPIEYCNIVTRQSDCSLLTWFPDALVSQNHNIRSSALISSWDELPSQTITGPAIHTVSQTLEGEPTQLNSMFPLGLRIVLLPIIPNTFLSNREPQLQCYIMRANWLPRNDSGIHQLTWQQNHSDIRYLVNPLNTAPDSIGGGAGLSNNLRTSQ